MSMILAAACHPEAQARVREELDLVVGRDRGRRILVYHGRWLMTPPLSTHMGGRRLTSPVTSIHPGNGTLETCHTSW